jgi:hypothetical protein
VVVWLNPLAMVCTVTLGTEQFREAVTLKVAQLGRPWQAQYSTVVVAKLPLHVVVAVAICPVIGPVAKFVTFPVAIRLAATCAEFWAEDRVISAAFVPMKPKHSSRKGGITMANSRAAVPLRPSRSHGRAEYKSRHRFIMPNMTH